MLEPKAPPARNVTNTGSLAPGVRRRVNKKTGPEKSPEKFFHIRKIFGFQMCKYAFPHLLMLTFKIPSMQSN